MDKVGQKVQTSSCKMSKFRGYQVQHSDYGKQSFAVYLKVVQREVFKRS